MKKLICIAAALLIFPSVAFAGTVNFGVELPTQRDDQWGTPLPLSEIAAIVLQCGTKTGEFSPAGTVSVDNTWFGSSGTHICNMRVKDTAGKPSGVSNTVEVTFDIAPPKPPVIVGVQYTN